jgi:NAD(P)-dependent dehydrogenase (short-subunit alcohol dehydrogenase family)
MRVYNIPLVTGANRGIGFEAARQLSAKGFHVLVGSRNHTAGEKAVAALRKSGADAARIRLKDLCPSNEL